MKESEKKKGGERGRDTSCGFVDCYRGLAALVFPPLAVQGGVRAPFEYNGVEDGKAANTKRRREREEEKRGKKRKTKQKKRKNNEKNKEETHKKGKGAEGLLRFGCSVKTKAKRQEEAEGG